MKKLGFVGMGNMAQAMAKGFIDSGIIKGKDVFAYAPNQEKLKANAEKIGFIPCASLDEVIEGADFIIAACKPYQIKDVFEPIKDKLAGKVLVSVAASWYFAEYKELLGERVRVQVIMPNTPVAVRRGVLVIEEENDLEPDERIELIKLLEAVGSVVELPRKLFGVGSSVSGCGPAFMDMVIEAMADGAVKNGIPRPEAYELICQMMIGSAELVMQSGLHPGQLKDNVCSPGGITIKGVAALEEGGIRSAFIKAIDAIS
ncbi:MAG: pyrroline-5-carboxylate reductase [Firmicutes bacterium]|nr:pyrroline-5-carboxylate reductase [Bacillota bacterium]